MPTQANPNEKALARVDATKPCNVAQLRDVFEKALPQIRDALPAALKQNAARMARCAVTEFQRNPALAQCTGLSLLSCAMQAAQLGLEIGGPTGHSYMVPYKRRIKTDHGEIVIEEATFQLGYRGMITLAFRSGEVANIYAACVRQKDRFRMVRGTAPGIEHEPAWADAGPIIGVYAVLVYKSGQINYEWMATPEIEQHKNRYSKQSNNSPWVTAWPEMARKTVVRKLLKYAPLAVDFPPDLDDPDDVAPTVTTPALPAEPSSPAIEGEAQDQPGDSLPADGLWGGEEEGDRRG
jgi:recombination protein RecT